MTSPEYGSHFSIANIPFGVASCKNHPQPQCVTRLENTVIFLSVLQQAGAFSQISTLPQGVFEKPSLNDYAALPKATHREVRKVLQDILTKTLPTNSVDEISAVTLHLPVTVGGFTDFSCSLNHMKNGRQAILGDDTPPPGFFHFPIAYNGRASTIFPSGTPITRPHGHFYDRTASSEEKPVIFAPSRTMDWELEMGVIIGQGVSRLQGLNAKDADEHIFGMVILNDWSSRDIQGLEMPPLGPLNSKAFGTSISPWVITLDALDSFKVPGTKHEIPISSHLEDETDSCYAINLQVEWIVDGKATLVSRSKAQDMHWNGRQMCAHLASTGADLRTGDILGTGTVSGMTDESLGCLLEITKAGKKPVILSDGSERHFLQDGDVVRMTGVVGNPGSGVGFGECIGELLPARVV